MALSQKKLQQKRSKKNAQSRSMKNNVFAHARSLLNLKDKIKLSFGVFGNDKDDVKDVRFLLNAGYDPLHAIYVAAQNIVSKISEELQDIKQLNDFYNIYNDAIDEYLPQGPPMSPLTRSYFTCWAFFDLLFDYGRTKKSIGECIIDLNLDEHFGNELSMAIKNMQQSRMGVYEHCGTKRGKAILEDIWTKERSICYVPVDYLGTMGELWFVRVMPPIDGHDYSVVFNSPYILLNFTKSNWIAYIERSLNKSNQESSSHSLFNHFKYGTSLNYWNEFVFVSYVNNTQSVIYLTGLPDQKHTLPHA